MAAPLRASFALDLGFALGGGAVLSAAVTEGIRFHLGGVLAFLPDAAATSYGALGIKLGDELELMGEAAALPLRGAVGALWRPAGYVELRLAGRGFPLSMWGALTVRF